VISRCLPALGPLCFGAAVGEPGLCSRRCCRNNAARVSGVRESSRAKKQTSGAVQGGDGAPSEPRLARTESCLGIMCIIISTRGLLFRQRRLSFLQQFPEITLGKCENLELLNLPGGRCAGGWRREEGTPAFCLPCILAIGPGDGEEGAHQPPSLRRSRISAAPC